MTAKTCEENLAALGGWIRKHVTQTEFSKMLASEETISEAALSIVEKHYVTDLEFTELMDTLVDSRNTERPEIHASPVREALRQIKRDHPGLAERRVSGKVSAQVAVMA